MLTPRLERFALSGADGAPGHSLSCALWGDAAKPALLCVHGLTRNGRDFDYMAQDLAAEYFVICPDVPGRGKSPWLADISQYNNTVYLADILQLLARLNLTRVHWLGTSMGGILGLLAANAAPGLLASLVLNDIGCVVPGHGLMRIRESAKLPPDFATREACEAAFRMRTATFGITEEAHWQHLLAHSIEQTPDGRWRLAYDPGIFTAAFVGDAPIADVDLWPLWPAAQKLPMLLLRGAQSDILLADTARAMQATHERLMLREFDGVGHAPALMDEKERAPIRQWMSALSKG
ncbi:MAG: alpha/beta fold hydrolase [Proteobacteria bacterium]|nr:alpha/beta fold hydrolase [Pseudomonadota bacterium]